MEKYLKEKCELFARNRLLMQQGFSWEYPAVNGLVAMLYTVYDKELDIDLIRSCRRVMRPRLVEQGFVDGPGIIAASAMVSLAYDPVEAFHYTIKLYNMFIAKGFQPSLYFLLASINIAKHKDENEFATMVDRAEKYYQYLKSQQSIELYGKNQTYKETLAAIFAERDVESYVEDTRKCFQYLRPHVPTEAAGFVLTDTILTSGKDIEKHCQYAIALNEKLKDYGYEWQEDFQYAILGVLALMGKDMDVDLYVKEVLQVIDMLKADKNLANIKLEKDHWLTYAALLTEMIHLKHEPAITSIYFEKTFVDMNIALIVNMVEEAHHLNM